MPATVVVSFLLCWTAFVLGALFIFSPEIKRIVLQKDKLEFEHFKKRVDKALVEYDEFKQTIYPLLEINLGIIGTTGYLSATPKPDVMIDFLNRIEELAEKGIYDKTKLAPLIDATKAQTLSAFSNDLNLILVNSLGDEYSSKVESYLITGLENDYSKSNYVVKGQANVNFKGLKELGSDLPVDGKARQRYFNKLADLHDFYETYYDNQG